MQSCVQVYTGDGKGKTTAAVGLAVRAAGHGLSVKFVQFLKCKESGEIGILKNINGIEILRSVAIPKFFNQLSDNEKSNMRADAKAALVKIKSWLNSADVLIIDEAMAALSLGLLELHKLIDIIENRGKTEIVLTGRDAPEQIIKRAQLVTDMRSIKHYFESGRRAKKGIEY